MATETRQTDNPTWHKGSCATGKLDGCNCGVVVPVTSPAEMMEMTVDTLVRSMIETKSSTIAIYIDGVEYHLSLDYVG